LRDFLAKLKTLYGFGRSRWHSTCEVAKWIYHALLKRDLFTNACGDFTLLSKEDWLSLRGYPEWAMYSWHLDSIIVYQANRNGITEMYLGNGAPVYHIEHEPGSGFTPESSDKLFARLESSSGIGPAGAAGPRSICVGRAMVAPAGRDTGPGGT
jgi:hypothetical protein